MSKFDYPEEVEQRHMDILDAVKGIRIDRLRELAEAECEGRVVVLPCKRGDKLYRITNEYRVGLRVTEYYVRGFHKIGKGKDVFVEVSVNGSKLTNIIKYGRFYKTKAEAVRALSATEPKGGLDGK